MMNHQLWFFGQPNADDPTGGVGTFYIVHVSEESAILFHAESFFSPSSTAMQRSILTWVGEVRAWMIKYEGAATASVPPHGFTAFFKSIPGVAQSYCTSPSTPLHLGHVVPVVMGRLRHLWPEWKPIEIPDVRMDPSRIDGEWVN